LKGNNQKKIKLDIRKKGYIIAASQLKLSLRILKKIKLDIRKKGYIIAASQLKLSLRIKIIIGGLI
jgi:hypothetical protein